MMKSLFVFALLALASRCANGYNILGFFPSGSKSHQLVHSAIAQTLAEAGHNVTVITGLPDVYKNSKYRHLQIGNAAIDQKIMNDMVNNPMPFYQRFPKIFKMFNKGFSDIIKHPDMVRFMRDERDSFDLLIVGYFMNDFHYGLAAHFHCPLVVSLMIQPMTTINKLVGNPLELAYVPTMQLGMNAPLNFMGRVKNYLMHFGELFVAAILDSNTKTLYSEHFPADKYPPFDEVKKNVSLVLANHHFISQGTIRPNVPSIIEIGGIQIKEKPNPLPADLANILDNSPKGVIYLSFGSNIQGSILSKEKVKIMYNVLSKLPYTVLWKWGDSDFPGDAKNIVFKSWLPQDDILAHPNVKLFITHGGKGSVVESQYHGVPMVGIPMFAEQPANVDQLVESGFGQGLDYSTLTEEDFRKAILEVITNPKYKQAVQNFSTLYRDRPLTARQSVVYWVEYVIRHQGAKHLQSPAVHLNAFQLMSLDVIGFLLVIVLGPLFIFIALCKMCCCRRKLKNVQKASKAKKNK